MVRPHCSLESPSREKVAKCVTGWLRLFGLSMGSNILITGSWRKFQVRAVSTSVSDRRSHCTERMFLVVSDGHISVSPPVQTRAHKLKHVFQRILIRHRASQSAGNAIQQHQDGNGKVLVTVFVPCEKQKVQLHLWVTSLRWARRHRPPISERQMQWFMLWDFVIINLSVTASLAGHVDRLARKARVSLCRGSAGSRASVSVSRICHTSSGAISTLHGVSRLSKKNCPRPCSGFHRPPSV